METRKDLESVASYISRLLSIGIEFKRNDENWSHLKNKEDFRFITRIPYEKRHKVEAVYADGRDMAIYMKDALLSINYDFSRYPTLTSIIDAFKTSWVYGKYDSEVPGIAKNICMESDVDLWSVGQMIILFKKQENLLEAVRVTLKILQDSDLYKMENGIPIMMQDAKINISGISGSSVNINSSGATASISTTYTEPTIFLEMISAIKSHQLDDETKKGLIDNVSALISSHKSGGFKEAYKNFMQNASAHVTVFVPFLAGLSALL